MGARENAGGQYEGRDPGVSGKALTAPVSRLPAHKQHREAERQAALAELGWSELSSANLCSLPRSNLLCRFLMDGCARAWSCCHSTVVLPSNGLLSISFLLILLLPSRSLLLLPFFFHSLSFVSSLALWNFSINLVFIWTRTSCLLPIYLHLH